MLCCWLCVQCHRNYLSWAVGSVDFVPLSNVSQLSRSAEWVMSFQSCAALMYLHRYHTYSEAVSFVPRKRPCTPSTLYQGEDTLNALQKKMFFFPHFLFVYVIILCMSEGWSCFCRYWESWIFIKVKLKVKDTYTSGGMSYATHISATLLQEYEQWWENQKTTVFLALFFSWPSAATWLKSP